MRLAFPLALLWAALTIQSAGAITPPLPEDLKPREWKPNTELRQILREIEGVGDEDQMRAYLAKVEALLDKHPDWVDLHRHYIGITRPMNKWPEIQPRYKERAAKDSTNADLQYLLGLFERGPAQEAFYRKALALDPKHYYARCGLGLTLMASMTQRPDEAFPILFEAARMRPDHPYAYQALAVAYESSKDFETAIRLRKMCQILEPDSFQPVNKEAIDLQQAGRPQESLARVEAFSKEHPDSRDALRALVDLYKTSNRTADAIASQIKLANVAKDSGQEAYKTACMLAINKDDSGAREWLAKAADRGWDDYRQAKTEPALATLRADSSSFAGTLDTFKRQHEKEAPEHRARVLSEMVNRPAPDFEVKTLDGRDIKLADLKGKVVVLDFWATWCGPCRRTLPLVRDLHAALQGKPVEILCMNVWEKDPDRVKVEPYWKENGYPMTVGLGSAEDAKNYEVTGIPTLFVLDGEGQMRLRHVGYTPFMDEEVIWVVESLLSGTDQGANAR